MIERVDPETKLVIARCRGDSGEVYMLGHSKDRWGCTCAELKGNCSHLQALKLVVAL